MDGMTSKLVTRRGSDAVLLSLLSPGLGHHYVGEAKLARRILVWVGIGWASMIALAVWLEIDPLWLLAFAIAIGVSAQLGLAMDAYRRAKRYATGYEPRPCNSARGYLGYFALWIVVVALPHELRRELVIEGFMTPAGAMSPTLRVGDHFVVTKLAARDRHPQRGDLVVFGYPPEPEEMFIKRLVGLPGETLSFYPDGRIAIDGVVLAREEVPPPEGITDGKLAQYFTERTPEGTSYTVRLSRDLEGVEPRADALGYEVQVPAGHMFVLGDNRRDSHDSSKFGPVPLALLEGRTRAIVMPLDRTGTLR